MKIQCRSKKCRERSAVNGPTFNAPITITIDEEGDWCSDWQEMGDGVSEALHVGRITCRECGEGVEILSPVDA